MFNSYYLQVLVVVGINIILALGLNLITGVTGQLSLGHAAFMSIGAYTSAILTLKYQLPFVVVLLSGSLVAAFLGIVLGFPTLRLSGDYLAITTLGFGEITRVILLNMDIAGKALGLAGIARKANIYNVYILVVLAVFTLYRLTNSRVGRAFKAIREDEIAAESAGIPIARYKIMAFSIGSFFAGLGGGLYAHYLTYINPMDFGFMKSIELLNIVVLGGMGSIPGSILGAFILTVAPEMLRFVQDYRMLFYGAVLVFMMIFRPNGLLGGVNLTDLLPGRGKRMGNINK
jgi:branched-chain amino acid transport system permease protein